MLENTFLTNGRAKARPVVLTVHRRLCPRGGGRSRSEASGPGFGASTPKRAPAAALQQLPTRGRSQRPLLTQRRHRPGDTRLPGDGCRGGTGGDHKARPAGFDPGRRGPFLGGPKPGFAGQGAAGPHPERPHPEGDARASSEPHSKCSSSPNRAFCFLYCPLLPNAVKS